jgi:hypothetical protein
MEKRTYCYFDAPACASMTVAGCTDQANCWPPERDWRWRFVCYGLFGVIHWEPDHKLLDLSMLPTLNTAGRVAGTLGGSQLRSLPRSTCAAVHFNFRPLTANHDIGHPGVSEHVVYWLVCAQATLTETSNAVVTSSRIRRCARRDQVCPARSRPPVYQAIWPRQSPQLTHRAWAILVPDSTRRSRPSCIWIRCSAFTHGRATHARADAKNSAACRRRRGGRLSGTDVRTTTPRLCGMPGGIMVCITLSHEQAGMGTAHGARRHRQLRHAV